MGGSDEGGNKGEQQSIAHAGPSNSVEDLELNLYEVDDKQQEDDDDETRERRGDRGRGPERERYPATSGGAHRDDAATNRHPYPNKVRPFTDRSDPTGQIAKKGRLLREVGPLSCVYAVYLPVNPRALLLRSPTSSSMYGELLELRADKTSLIRGKPSGRDERAERAC